MTGLIRYGAYVPRHRLTRSEIAAARGGRPAKGSRAVASYDEDTTSMAVEAARPLLRGLAPEARPERLLVATANPPYLEKTNATVVHAALRLDPESLAVDVNGAVRSGVGALLLAADGAAPTLVVLSDLRTGLPGSADERDGGDGAAAFLFGSGTDEAPVLAELVGHGSATGEFLDRWRIPGAPSALVWEERFGEHAYLPLAEASFAAAAKNAGIGPPDIDVLLVAGVHDRAVRGFATAAGSASSAGSGEGGAGLLSRVGNAGTAQPGLALADALDRAGSGQVIALVVLADGATTLLWRTTEALGSHRASSMVAAQVEEGDRELRYTQFLSWRGMLAEEPPRRPDPASPAAPPALRRSEYKYGFVGSRCLECGTVHLPPGRVCFACRVTDRMEPVPMADVPGTVVTYTVDHLAYSPSPPVVTAVVDFDGGGRFTCELTDVDPSDVRIGDRVEMTFRRVVTASGIHNYFWKARPAFAREACQDAASADERRS